ncbi:MAG: aminoacyl-tRNA hydrolase [Candidatus Aenigmarchaeota archaeon]|nr:aminoacyl-tRNA hydrolase [Candidatus Aenigmarchaeota archaeon]
MNFEKTNVKKEKIFINYDKLIKELTFDTFRSGGPGGQNVNKVETAIRLHWKIDKSKLFTNRQKEIIKRQLAGSRLVNGNEIVIKSQKSRFQEQNKQTAIKKLIVLLRQVLTPKKERIPTRPPASANKKRLNEKKKQAQKKKQRRKPKQYDY